LRAIFTISWRRSWLSSGKHDADEFALHGGIQTEVRFVNGFLDGAGAGGVPRLQEQHARLGRGDAGQLANAHVRSIHFHHDVLDERGRGFAGAHAVELVLHHFLGLHHLLFRFEQNVIEVHRRGR
jgi:hypothetical protein